MDTKGLRNVAIVSFIVAMSLLLLGGYFAKDKVPPIPGQVVSSTGAILIESSDIKNGQKVYQRYGLMDHGSVWGHGSLRGMDFSAHTLHMMGQLMRNYHANNKDPKSDAYQALSKEKRGMIDLRVIDEIHTNRYDAKTKVLTLTEAQAFAFEQISDYWGQTFKNGDPRYGFFKDTIPSDDEREQIASFFF